jgi:hypothetical protein
MPALQKFARMFHVNTIVYLKKMFDLPEINRNSHFLSLYFERSVLS